LYLSTNILKVDIDAMRADLPEAGCQVLRCLVVEGSIIPELVFQKLDL